MVVEKSTACNYVYFLERSLYYVVLVMLSAPVSCVCTSGKIHKRYMTSCCELFTIKFFKTPGPLQQRYKVYLDTTPQIFLFLLPVCLPCSEFKYLQYVWRWRSLCWVPFSRLEIVAWLDGQLEQAVENCEQLYLISKWCRKAKDMRRVILSNYEVNIFKYLLPTGH
jgi:hypothetical protein